MGDEDECLDVGALQAYADGPTTFGVQSHYRAKAREAFDGTVVNESDAPLCEGPRLWLDPTKLEILSRTSQEHAQANTESLHLPRREHAFVCRKEKLFIGVHGLAEPYPADRCCMLDLS